jgi:hypothetical protein
MKVWILTPKGQSRTVKIRAETEERARQIAYHAFSEPSPTDDKDDIFQPSKWAGIDWKNINAVSCVYETDDISNIEGIINVD